MLTSKPNETISLEDWPDPASKCLPHPIHVFGIGGAASVKPISIPTLRDVGSFCPYHGGDPGPRHLNKNQPPASIGLDHHPENTSSITELEIDQPITVDQAATRQDNIWGDNTSPRLDDRVRQSLRGSPTNPRVH